MFLLSEADVYNTDEAQKYGFDKEVENAPKKRSYCRTYAYAMGTTRYNNSYYL